MNRILFLFLIFFIADKIMKILETTMVQKTNSIISIFIFGKHEHISIK